MHLLHIASQAAASTPDRPFFWEPYVRQLPRSYTTFCCFSQEDVEQLQVPHAMEAAQAAVDKARDEWEGAQALMEALGELRSYSVIVFSTG